VEEKILEIVESEKIRALFAEHPLAEAEILDWVGSNAYYTDSDGRGVMFTMLNTTPGVDRRKKAAAQLRHLKRAWELRRDHLGPDDSKTLATAHRYGLALGSESHTEEAIKVLDDLVARSNAALGPDHGNTL